MIRVALPRGDLREPLAERLADAGFPVAGYGEGSRDYRFAVAGRPGVAVRVFSDHDIPVQVALGQYDLGITHLARVDELLVRYMHDSVVPLRPLDIGGERIVVAGAPGADLGSDRGRASRTGRRGGIDAVDQVFQPSANGQCELGLSPGNG